MKKFWRIVKAILLFWVFVGVFVVRILQMDTLMLNTLQIEASEHITEEVFRETTEIITHQNILRYDLTEKEQAIKSHPYIQEVEIKRKYPDTLEIKLKEREEYAIIPYNGNYLFVDRELYLLRVADSYMEGEVPVLREVEVQNITLGDPVTTDNDALVKFTFDAYEALSVSDFASIVAEFYLLENELIIETTEHIDIVLGMNIDLPYTIVATEEVYKDLMSRNQRNVSIISKYEAYIYVESGTFMDRQQSNMNEEEGSPDEEGMEMKEEPTGDN